MTNTQENLQARDDVLLSSLVSTSNAIVRHDAAPVIVEIHSDTRDIDENLIERAEVVSDNGIYRSKYLSGWVIKYTWQGVGTSYLPGELT